MPSNQTKNYQLSQWVKTDKVLMDDFNADNSKIDAALAAKAEQSSLESLRTTVSGKADQSALDALKQTVNSHTSTLDRKGNCRIHTQTYTGAGTYGCGNPNKLTFPAKPVVVFIGDISTGGDAMMAFYGQPVAFAHSSNYSLNEITWTETTMSWYHAARATGQLNQTGVQYSVAALIEL